MPKRWDDDDRGHGVGDAAQLVGGATELVAAFAALRMPIASTCGMLRR